MTRRARPPLRDCPPGVRQRQRADGAWRVWWEPSAQARALGFRPEELTPDTIGMRRAADLQRKAAEAVGAAPPQPGREIPAARTVRALIATYTADDYFLTRLRPATQQDYRKAFRLIELDWGDQLVTAISRAAVRAWRQQVLACQRPWQPPARQPGERRAHQARALVVKFSVLMAHAEVIGWTAEDSNPCLRLDGKRRLGIETPPRARVAGWDELAALMRAARAQGDESMACAIALAVFTGQRQADILKATAAEFAAPGVWTLIRSKRQNLGRLALHPDAQAALARWRAVRPASDAAELLLSERTGEPYSADLFRKVWSRARAAAARALRPADPAAAAALLGLQFRDLRRTYGALARHGGAAREDVGSVLGNTAATDPRLEATYMPAADAIAARATAAIITPAALRRELFDAED